MIRTLLRFLLIRVLPRRLVPLLTLIEVVRLLRAFRRRRSEPDDVADARRSTVRPQSRSPEGGVLHSGP